MPKNEEHNITKNESFPSPVSACDKKILSKLSPLQKQIVQALEKKPLTLCELSDVTGKSVFTIGKQLSILQLRTEYNPLKQKGITEPIIVKAKDKCIKTTYHIKK